MSGNVWEWVWDWYGSYPSSVQTDPMGPASGRYRVYRGGSGLHSSMFLRPAKRNSRDPGSRGDCLGFRLARPPVR
jgi:formylglycine-generating enzyme required for sulfatase activity